MQPTNPAWQRGELQDDAWQLTVEPEQVRDLLSAVAAGAGRPWQDSGLDGGPASCRPLWQDAGDRLERQTGFCVIRGLPALQGEEARRLAFLIGHGLGTPVFQDAMAGRIVHIRSTDAEDRDAALYTPKPDGTHTRPYETRNAFRLHSDPCDVAALYCVENAGAGGTSTIVSAPAVYEELRRHYAEDLAALQQPFDYARPRRPGEPVSWHGIPVFTHHEGWFKTHVVPDLIYAAQLIPEVPRLDGRRRDALLRMDEVASRPEFLLRYRLEPGDVLLLNNHLVWHGREAYTDGEARIRHLLRLWLAVPGSRPLHPVHAGWFGDPAAGALRGGYLRERLAELVPGPAVVK